MVLGQKMGLSDTDIRQLAKIYCPKGEVPEEKKDITGAYVWIGLFALACIMIGVAIYQHFF